MTLRDSLAPQAGTRPALSAAALARALLSGVIIGMMAIVFSVSFAAIVYTGDLAVFLSRGVGLTLIGATIMAVAGAFGLSYRGTIVQPQDVTALILSLAAARIAIGWNQGPPEALFATVAVLVALATALTGVAAYAFGRLRLGFVARFIPYPVLGGFLAATGYLLVTGALGMMLGQSVGPRTAQALLAPGAPVKWMPWAAVAVLFCILSYRLRNGLVLPLCIVLATLGFHAALRLAGLDLSEAQAMGLLLGRFEEARLYAGLGPWILAEAEWGLALAQMPSILAVAGMTIIGALLYASALELASGEAIDPDRDLRGVGIANLLASMGGGLVGYHLLSQTLFARTLGVTGRLAGLAVAVVTGATLVFGATYLSVLPIGVFAAVILFLGFDLLLTWLWIERRRLPARDFAIVLLILGVAATIGFLQAIAVGVLAASMQFVIAYAGTDVVRLRTTAATLRSRVERGEAELARLSETGRRAVVYVLAGHLFFGTASRLLAELAAIVTAAPERRPSVILLDLRRVTGIDASAAFALEKLHRTALASGVELVLCATAPSERDRLNRLVETTGEEAFRFAADLDEALRAVEDRLLSEAPERPEERAAADFLDELARRHPGADLSAIFQDSLALAGEVVIEQGEHSDGMILLRAGRLRVEHLGPDGAATPLATVLPGALVGELGFYAGSPRTARVTAETDCRLVRLDRAALEAVARGDPALAADLHRSAAAHLARRLMRVGALLRASDR